MIKYVELTAPDKSDFRQAKILSIECQEGDVIKEGDTLFKVKSGSNKIDLPATKAGRIVEMIVSEKENITISTALLLLETEVKSRTATKPIVENQEVAEKKATNKKNNKINTQESLNLDGNGSSTEQLAEEQATETAVTPATPDVKSTPKTSPIMSSNSIIEVTVPDIGADSAKVIEILVNIGDTVATEDPLITLESDKASMDVPSTHDGVIKSIAVSLDQDINEGTVILELEAAASAETQVQEEPQPDNEPQPDSKPQTEKEPQQKQQPQAEAAEEVNTKPQATPAVQNTAPQSKQGKSHASPSVRRFARELGVDLTQFTGSGRKGRITKDDVKGFVKESLLKPASSDTQATSGAGIPAIPAQDFSKFGEIDIQPLNKIKKLTAANLHRSWLNVPHVTHNDESNINDLEAFRKQLNAEYAKTKQDIKLSPLAFIVKAMVNALQRFPQFNSSLEPGGENLIYKQYFNIGIAVETPNGLVVPVIKEADKKSVAEIAVEMGELAKKARDKKLTMADMSGACITISSLGGIGGTGFTPIVNAPEVAILGVSRSKVQPVWNGSEFEPGMILPLSLSYDHRVIDGAEAARFTRHIAALLEDIRRLTV